MGLQLIRLTGRGKTKHKLKRQLETYTSSLTRQQSRKILQSVFRSVTKFPCRLLIKISR